MKKKPNAGWVARIVLISVTASMAFTLASTEILGRVGHVLAFLLLAVFIIIGILFDIIAVAVTVSTEAPFHSMAAHRQRGAAECLKLVRNADKTASVCGDVVGDVTGIISGATAVLITARLMQNFNTENLLLQLLIPGMVTGLTIGGKAVAKGFALNNNVAIVLKAGKSIDFFSRLTQPKKKRKPTK